MPSPSVLGQLGPGQLGRRVPVRARSIRAHKGPANWGTGVPTKAQRIRAQGDPQAPSRPMKARAIGDQSTRCLEDSMKDAIYKALYKLWMHIHIYMYIYFVVCGMYSLLFHLKIISQALKFATRPIPNDSL